MTVITNDKLTGLLNDINTIDDVVESTGNTTTSKLGTTVRTLKGFNAAGDSAISQFESQGGSSISQFEDDAGVVINNITYAVGHNIAGDFSTLDTVTNSNDVLTSKSITGFEDAIWRTNQELPYAPTGTDPTQSPELGKWVAVAAGELKAIARSLNVADTAVIYSTDTVTLLDNVSYIYDAPTQTTWGVPTLDSTGKTVASVSGSDLTTTGGTGSNSYTLITQEKSDLKMTLAEATSSTSISLNDSIRITDRYDGVFDVVLASGVTPNGFNIVQCSGVPELALELRYSENIIAGQWGYTADANYRNESTLDWFVDSELTIAATDNTPVIEIIRANAQGRKILLPAGNAIVSGVTIGGGDSASVKTSSWVGEFASFENGINNGTAWIMAPGSTPVEVFGVRGLQLKNIVVDLNGNASTILKIKAVNPISSLSSLLDNVWLWDSTYGYDGVGIELADETVNQVSEWLFKRVFIHESLSVGCIQSGDNTVNVNWDKCLFRTADENYHAKGGCSVTFANGTQMSRTTSGPLVKVFQAAGTNNPSVQVVPSLISFQGWYSEPDSANGVVDFSGVTDDTLIPDDSDQGNEYPGRTQVEFIGSQMWCSNPITIVNPNSAVAKIDLTIIGGRYHDAIKPMGGYTASIHNVNVFSPTVTGIYTDSFFEQANGAPAGIYRGILQANEQRLSNTNTTDHKFINEDDGGFQFDTSAGAAMFRIRDDEVGIFGGTWENPWKFGSRYEWYDGTGNKRAKVGLPGSSTDGVIISSNPVT